MAGSKTKITPGYPQIWEFGSRLFGGRAAQIGTISDVDGSWTFGTPASFTGGLTKGGAPVLAGAPFAVGCFVGGASAGSIAVAGAKVGDIVAGVANITTHAMDTSHFEGVVSVAGHIQQLSADLSADTFLVLIVNQS